MKLEEKINRISKNSMLFWFPKVSKLGIPIPKTEIVEIEKGDYVEYLDDPTGFPKDIEQRLKDAGRKIGYPLFLRTDQLSGKHDPFVWVPYVPSEEDLMSHILMLIDESACAGILGLPINAFVFREFLELDAKFKAFSGMPIARERRYFIKDGEVLCHHPYWIEKAIRFWQKAKPPENWKLSLRELNHETSDEVKILEIYSRQVAQVLDGFWSIDFARAKDWTWYLIDIATGEDSWHPSDCPNCPEELRKEMQKYEKES